jgi:hypothetical protein
MRRFLWVFLSIICYLPFGLFAATYNGENIDNIHISAALQLIKYFPENISYKNNIYDEYGNKEEPEYNSYGIYDVDVVFLEKEAKIVFHPNPAVPLPDVAKDTRRLTLYLTHEDIENPFRIQVKHTLNTSDVISREETDPHKMPILALWLLSLNMDEYNGRRRTPSDGSNSLGVVQRKESALSNNCSQGEFKDILPDCSVVLFASVKNLHYPAETNLIAAVKKAESSLSSYHYRKAIQKVHPGGILPEKVDKVAATARYGKDVKGFNSGIVVDAKVWYCLRDQ